MITTIEILIMIILFSLAITIAGPIFVAVLGVVRASILDLRDYIKQRRAIKGKLDCEYLGWEGQYPNRERIGCLNKAEYFVEGHLYLCDLHADKRPLGMGGSFQRPVSMLAKPSRKVIKR